MIKESYVSFETAKLLKEAGFDVPTSTHYSNSGEVWQSPTPVDYNDDKSCKACSRPTQALVARWLREVHHILIMLNPTLDGWVFDLFNLKGHHYILCNQDANADSYEQAMEAGLREAIKQIKK